VCTKQRLERGVSDRITCVLLKKDAVHRYSCGRIWRGRLTRLRLQSRAVRRMRVLMLR